MAWLALAAAIAVEVGASTALKVGSTSAGSSGLLYTTIALGGVLASYALMAEALRLQMEISVAYAVWSGVGTAAIAIIGALFFRESLSPTKSIALILIITGVALLQMANHPPSATPSSSLSASLTSDEAVILALAGTLRELGQALATLPASASESGAAAGVREVTQWR